MARLENLVAGITGGFASTLLLHPLDLVKIRFQVNEGIDSSRPQYRHTFDAIRSIFRTEGIRGLYKGLTPNLAGSCTSWGIFFYAYNAIKLSLADWSNFNQTEAGRHLVAAAIAGSLTLALTNPLWVVKTRMCLEYDSASRRYHSMADAFLKIYRLEGFSGLYKGFLPGLLGVSHGALQFMAYEDLQRRHRRWMEMKDTDQLVAFEYILLAALSKVFATVLTYPYQVVRSRLQDQHRNYEGIKDVIRDTWKRERVRGFYKGLGTNLLRVTPGTCITFVVYEKVCNAHACAVSHEISPSLSSRGRLSSFSVAEKVSNGLGRLFSSFGI
ncbi:solute carrier family 25 member 32-like [Oscarella lobularis]|uniref:solute carrier family 25 member 32-like n=1 Tax=Oscarella lobularis TaxID=121494 RepID=UPI0033137E50